jgi:hypothetical protein
MKLHFHSVFLRPEHDRAKNPDWTGLLVAFKKPSWDFNFMHTLAIFASSWYEKRYPWL